MKLEEAITEFRKNDQQRFQVKILDVNWVGRLRYLLRNLSFDVLLEKEFELYNILEENK